MTSSSSQSQTADQPGRLEVIDLPERHVRATGPEALGEAAPWLFVALLLLVVALQRLFSGGRSGAKRTLQWFTRYWLAFFGLKYNPSKRSSLRKLHSRSRER
ncbi:MAG: hypothetical protein ACKN89_05955 [Cyanobium sp.]|nr:hypothetical protein [Synechococcaceae cyanobacterium]